MCVPPPENTGVLFQWSHQGVSKAPRSPIQMLCRHRRQRKPGDSLNRSPTAVSAVQKPDRRRVSTQQLCQAAAAVKNSLTYSTSCGELRHLTHVQQKPEAQTCFCAWPTWSGVCLRTAGCLQDSNLLDLGHQQRLVVTFPAPVERPSAISWRSAADFSKFEPSCQAMKTVRDSA